MSLEQTVNIVGIIENAAYFVLLLLVAIQPDFAFRKLKEKENFLTKKWIRIFAGIFSLVPLISLIMKLI